MKFLRKITLSNKPDYNGWLEACKNLNRTKAACDRVQWRDFVVKMMNTHNPTTLFLKIWISILLFIFSFMYFVLSSHAFFTLPKQLPIAIDLYQWDLIYNSLLLVWNEIAILLEQWIQNYPIGVHLFPNAFFLILLPWLQLTFIYYRCKYTVAKIIVINIPHCIVINYMSLFVV
jgi:hypothetical protein